MEHNKRKGSKNQEKEETEEGRYRNNEITRTEQNKR
jgi:hypothetical protein